MFKVIDIKVISLALVALTLSACGGGGGRSSDGGGVARSAGREKSAILPAVSARTNLCQLFCSVAS